MPDILEEERPLISVCVATRGRPRQLEVVLDGLTNQEDPPFFELLVCGNGDESVAEFVFERFPPARVWLIDRLHPGAARNILIDNARGHFLFFLDDDVVIERDTLGTLARLISDHPESAVFGGPNTTPPDSSLFQRIQGAVLASVVATGPVRRRYGRHPAGEADERYFTLCNLAIRRDVMLRFDTELVCAEENAILRELSRRDIRMHYDPHLVVHHDRRATFRSFVQQMFKYGRGRGQILARHPNSVNLAFMAAPTLVLYLVLAPVLLSWSLWFGLPILAWLLAVAAAAGKVALSMRRFGVAGPAFVQVASLHLCYGSGIWAGVLRPGRASGRGRLRAVKRTAREARRKRLSHR